MTPTGPKKSNWITTLFGILAVATQVAGFWVPAKYQQSVQNTGVVLTGAGLVAAKDSNSQ